VVAGLRRAGVPSTRLVKDGARETNRSTSRSAPTHRLENPGKILLELIEVQDRKLFRPRMTSSGSRTIIGARDTVCDSRDLKNVDFELT